MATHRSHCRSFTGQKGITLVEILVAIVIMSIVTVATMALYTTTSEGYRNVDADQEIQNNGRFALDQLAVAIRHAGYQERVFTPGDGSDQFGDTIFNSAYMMDNGKIPTRHIEAVNNSVITSLSSSTDFGVAGANNGVNASDVLTSRFFGSQISTDAASGSSSIMQSCMGIAGGYPTGVDDLVVSSFSVRILKNEPELYCKGKTTAGVWEGNQIVRGVETFQLVLGVSTDVTSLQPVRWLSPEQMVATDWPNVMAVRVGMVIRGAVGSVPLPPAALVYYPLGEAFANGNTTNSFQFTAPRDTRLRRVFNATYKLRNHTINR